MKKRIFSILLTAVLCLSFLPTAAFAATTLSHVDVQITLPNGGDAFDFGYIPTVTSFTGDGVDLLANGAGVMYASWSGDYDLGDDMIPYFRNGGAYNVTLQLMFGAGYCTNGTMAETGETVAMPEIFSATVNGVAATVRRNTSTYYPTIEVNLTLEGEVLNAEQKSERDEEWEQIKKASRAMSASRTRAEAETYNSNNIPEKVVVVNNDGTDLGYDDFENMTILVMDVNNAEKTNAYNLSPYTKEIWLSPETDPYKFIKAVKDSQWNSVGGYYYYEISAEYPLYLAEATVFIPESRVSEFKQKIEYTDNISLYPGGAFSIKCYSGDDVIAAQKAGASATKEICTEHEYTLQICSADRIYHYADCNDHYLYYFSCGYCGKCEYNPNHVAYSNEAINTGVINADSYKHIQRHGTVYAELPADAAYIGVNAAGEHVWWNSCPRCGVFDHYSVNEYDWKATGTQMSFEEYKASIVDAGNKKLEDLARNSTERHFPGTFSLPLKSDAYMSDWAQSDVNLALNDNLLDTAMLGGDYTQNISRLQFCSVAVKLAEELTGKSIAPADGGTFEDTSDTYALKAYAAGITSGVTATAFDPNGTLTRQQMATFLYRALRYVEQNSDYCYTDYTSKLANYTDSWSIQNWAEEAMAFMNALDLVKGTSDTALNPDGLCTIEQAVAVAERSVYAHLLGWYQVNRAKNMSPTSELGKGKMGGFALREGDYVWVTGRRYGAKTSVYSEIEMDSLYVPIINPFNGQAAEMKYGDLIPVRN